MTRFLIDVNLPAHLDIWQSADCITVRDIDEEMSNSAIWNHAKKHGLTIVTKDADFLIA